MDTRLNLKSPWPDVKERLKENDPTLSDADLNYEPGRENDLIGRLAKKSNRSAEQVRDYIESISANDDKSG
jgi:hypothetical protein